MATTFKKNIPNLISASRGVAALALLLTTALLAALCCLSATLSTLCRGRQSF